MDTHTKICAYILSLTAYYFRNSKQGLLNDTASFTAAGFSHLLLGLCPLKPPCIFRIAVYTLSQLTK